MRIYWTQCNQCPEPHPLLVGVMTVDYGHCPIAWAKWEEERKEKHALEALNDEALLGRKEEVGLSPAKGSKEK